MDSGFLLIIIKKTSKQLIWDCDTPKKYLDDRYFEIHHAYSPSNPLQVAKKKPSPPRMQIPRHHPDSFKTYFYMRGSMGFHP